MAKKNKKVIEAAAPAGPAPWLKFAPFVFLVWAFIVAYYYLTAYPVSLDAPYSFLFGDPEIGFTKIFYLLTYLPNAVGIALYGAAAYGLGCLVSKPLGLKFEADEKPFFCAGLGFTVFIYYMFVIGTLGFLYKIPVALPLLAGIGGFVADISAGAKTGEQLPAQSKKKLSLLVKILLGIGLATLVFIVIGSLAPETFYDTLNYHLGVPQHWLDNHRIFPIENMVYSYFTGNMHILYVPGLMFGNEISTKLTHFMFGILTLYAIFAWARRNFSAEHGAVAAFIFISVPFVSVVMWKTTIELSLTFYETLAVLSMVYFVTAPEEQKNKWLALSAVFSGTAVGGKYLSAFNAAGIGVVLLGYFIAKKELNRKNILRLCAFGAIVAALVSPYLIRNYELKGMPLYPFGYSFKHDIQSVVRNEVKEVSDPGVPDRSIGNFITLPWYIAMGKKTQEPFSGAALILLVPLLLLYRKTDTKAKLLAFYCLAYYAFWFYVRTYFRYIIPVLPALSIAYAYFIMTALRQKALRNTVLIILAVLGLSTITFISSSERFSMDPMRVVFGIQSKRDYLDTQRQTYPSPYYGAIDWANANLPPDSKILFLGESRTFYAKMKTVAYSTSDFCPLVLWLKDCNNADDAYAALKRNGVTHILLNAPEAKRLASYDMFHFDPAEFRVFIEFWNKYVKEVYRDVADISLPERGIFSLKAQQVDYWNNYSANPFTNVYLYEIMTPEEASKPHTPPADLFLTPQLYTADRWASLQAAFGKR